MNVEYVGRHTVITKKLKDQAEPGLERIGKMVGRSVRAHVILTTDKYRKIADVTVKASGQDLVATCEGTEMEIALRDAVAKVEQQVVRYKQKRMAIKRHPKTDRQILHSMADPAGPLVAVLPPASEPSTTPVVPAARKPAAGKPATRHRAGHKAEPMVVHSFPAKTSSHEPHLVKSWEGVATRPMTLEEAVKEAEFRDRDVFVFRDPTGQALVLHRRHDGKMELIEVP